MKVELLVSDWCPTCPQAEAVWRQAAEEKNFDFAVVDMAQPEGRALAHRLGIRTIPAVVIDGVLTGVGVQPLAEVRALVAAAPAKAASAARHAGMLLSADNRACIVSAMAYLAAAGLALPWHGSLLGDGAAGRAAFHVFGVGCVLLLIFGLGAHMLPRFTGNPIRMGAWPWLQLAAVHLGLMLFVLDMALGSSAAAAGGGFLLWCALLLFTVRLWPVLWPRAVR